MTELFDFYQADNAKAVFVFAHGAGAGKDHAFMQELSALLLAKQISVVRFNFPYMCKREEDGKRRPPDRFPALLAHYQQVLTELKTSLPVFIGGKSMGSRVAATLLAEPQVIDIKGGICIGYPFHPQKKPENLRLTPLQATQRPVLICQGDRDALGNKDEISSYQLADFCQVVYLPDGDHDLKPRVKSGFSHQQHKITTAKVIQEFIFAHC